MRIDARRLAFGTDRGARTLRAAITVAVSLGVVALLTVLPTVRLIELKVEDLRYRLRGERNLDERILVIEIDDATRDAYPHFPLDRGQYASLSLLTQRFGAVGVVYDLFFTDADSTSTSDVFFARSIELAPERTTLAAHLVDPVYADGPRDPESASTAIPGALNAVPPGHPLRTLTTDRIDGPAPLFAGAHHALATALESPDGSVRRLPLLARIGDAYLPSLALAAWMKLYDLRPDELTIDAASARLVDADGKPRMQLPSDLVAEIDYAGSVESFAPNRLGFVDALRTLKAANASDAPDAVKQRARELFEDKVVLVGLTARGSYMVDFGVTPFDSSAPLLYAHVNMLDTLLRDAPLERFPAALEYALTALFIGVGAWIAGSIRPWRLVVTLTVLVVAMLAAGQLVFVETGRMVDTVPHLAAVLLAFTGVGALAYGGQEQERQILRRTFGRYVSPELLDGILERSGQIDLGGDAREVTVVFFDIRGFTEWSRSLPPRVLVDELNAFLSDMVDVVFEHRGTVNKFIGDAVLAVFGAPISEDDDVQRAVRCADSLRDRLSAHNERRSQSGARSLRIGIGIASGEVVAGNVGSHRRLEYTVIGDPVNRAARLQTLSQDGQILLDEATARRFGKLDDRIRTLGRQTLKGLGEIEVFERVDAEEPGPRA